MQGIHLDFLSALLASVSAALWTLSARVHFPFGFDMDIELNKAMKKSAKLNASAAAIAALSAVAQAVKAALIGFNLLA